MSLRSTRETESQQTKSSEQLSLQKALSTIQDLDQQLQEVSSLNQKLEQRVRELTDQNVRQNESDKILEDNRKLIEENERLRFERDESVRNEQNAKRDAERTISTYKEKDACLDQIVEENAEFRFRRWKRTAEADIQNRINAAEIERERLWAQAQSQIDDLRNDAIHEADQERTNAQLFAASCRKHAVLLLILVALLGSIGSGILTNWIISVHQTTLIQSLESTVEEQRELLEAKYYVCTYKESVWNDQDDKLTLTSTSDPKITHRFRDYDIVRYMGRVDDQDGIFSAADMIVSFQGDEYIIPYYVFLMNFEVINELH